MKVVAAELVMKSKSPFPVDLSARRADHERQANERIARSIALLIDENDKLRRMAALLASQNEALQRSMPQLKSREAC